MQPSSRLSRRSRARHRLVCCPTRSTASCITAGARLDRALLPRGHDRLGGLSKWCGAGGWRLGTFCFPPPAVAARRDGGGRQRDLHLDERADPARGRDARSRAGIEIERTWHARGASSPRSAAWSSDGCSRAGVRASTPARSTCSPTLGPLRERLLARSTGRNVMAAGSRELGRAGGWNRAWPGLGGMKLEGRRRSCADRRPTMHAQPIHADGEARASPSGDMSPV
jgi:hypothetical protein